MLYQENIKGEIHMTQIYLFLFVVFVGAVLLRLLPDYIKFKGSNYHAVSGNNFFKTRFNTGNFGEFLTFSKLEKLKIPTKLLTNVYITKNDGTTTEIDLMMIAQTGIYVFESKNYSGWIFGDEKYKNWTQSLPNKQKSKFFNPIWQNKGHISALTEELAIEKENLYKSYIVFSERCTLKKITVTSPNVEVINRGALIRTIKKDIMNSRHLLTVEEMNKIHKKLQPLSHMDDAVKVAHIAQVKAKRFK